MDGPERLDGRDGQVWAAYISGVTQEAIARQHGVTQQRVSQILSEIRASIGDVARTDAALLAQERTDALLSAVWPGAMQGDPRAVGAALRVLERMAKATGSDAVEPLRVTLERRLDLEGDLVANALGAALDAAPELSHETRVAMLSAAQCVLLGEEPPAPVVAPSAEESGPDLMDDYRRFCEAEGVDPDEDQDDDEDDDEDDGNE